MKYIAIEAFTDLQDNNYKYQAGDEFPRKGFKVSDARIEELSTDKNRRERPMIKVVEEIKTEEIKPVEVKPELEKLEVPVSKKGKKKKDAE